MKQEENTIDPYDAYMEREEERKRYKILFSVIGIFFLTGCITAAWDYNHTKQLYERKILPREEMKRIEGNLESCKEIDLHGGRKSPDMHYFKIVFENGEEQRILEGTLDAFDQNAFQQLKGGSKVTLLLDESKNNAGVNGFEVAEVYSNQRYYLIYEDYVKLEQSSQEYLWKNRWISTIIFFMIGGGEFIGVTLLCWYQMEKERKAKESEAAAVKLEEQE